MPFINTKLNVELTEEKENILKTKFGDAISLIPGKSESWLMLDFEDNCHIYFRGDNSSPIAFVEINLKGCAPRNAYDALTKKITEILSIELCIDTSNIYIKFSETDTWGWNGANL
ncbi:MAG TPA: phenylpyruvate tautomerase MIF-related protein [Clostridia bacterium]|nr:phenylpyruvate tautomerase MIF-related protein [Clostridia bacterium]